MLYTKIERLMLSAAKGEIASSEDLHEIVSHFRDDLDETDLSKELALMKNVMTDCEFTYDTLRNKISEYRCVFPQVMRLLQLLLVIPANSATSELEILFSTSSSKNVSSDYYETGEIKPSDDYTHT